MTAIDDIAKRERLAIVGVAKNCGKTTTLNHLLELRRRHKWAPPSLVSAGVDGESDDVLLGTEKPPILVRPGQWVVTAEAALRTSTARFEFVDTLGFRTPLGEVFLCRTLEGGTVLLGGLCNRQELIRAVELLAAAGPGAVWVDGAYGRVVGAHPDVAPSVVVATGAICGGDIAEVVEKTQDLVSRLGLAAIDDDDTMGRRAIECAVEEGCVALVDDGEVVALETASAVVGLEELAKRWGSTTKAVAIPGLVSDRVVEELLALGEHRLYIREATAIHVDEQLWRRFSRAWDVRVARAIEVAAISYNPTSVTDVGVDASLLETALCDRFDGIAVFDPFVVGQ